MRNKRRARKVNNFRERERWKGPVAENDDPVETTGLSETL
jgi:hypothetical protein